MTPKVIIDTSFLCSFINSKDPLFEKSVAMYENFDNYNLFTSNFVLLETYTVLSQRAGKAVSIGFGEQIRDQENTKILEVSRYTENHAWEIFKSIKSKNVSYVDTTTIALVLEEGLDAIVTFDQDFKKLSRRFGYKVIDKSTTEG